MCSFHSHKISVFSMSVLDSSCYPKKTFFSNLSIRYVKCTIQCNNNHKNILIIKVILPDFIKVISLGVTCTSYCFIDCTPETFNKKVDMSAIILSLIKEKHIFQ